MDEETPGWGFGKGHSGREEISCAKALGLKPSLGCPEGLQILGTTEADRQGVRHKSRGFGDLRGHVEECEVCAVGSGEQCTGKC